MIPPHSEIITFAKLKKPNGRSGLSAGQCRVLHTFVNDHGILVGRALVRADAHALLVPVLLNN